MDWQDQLKVLQTLEIVSKGILKCFLKLHKATVAAEAEKNI